VHGNDPPPWRTGYSSVPLGVALSALPGWRDENDRAAERTTCAMQSETPLSPTVQVVLWETR
jgi:hypothetical protein